MSAVVSRASRDSRDVGAAGETTKNPPREGAQRPAAVQVLVPLIRRRGCVRSSYASDIPTMELAARMRNRATRTEGAGRTEREEEVNRGGASNATSAGL